jgi:hypothetical protein
LDASAGRERATRFFAEQSFKPRPFPGAKASRFSREPGT